jgi:hypothetical protein
LTGLTMGMLVEGVWTLGLGVKTFGGMNPFGGSRKVI